jgi:hypothetical protein
MGYKQTTVEWLMDNIDFNFNPITKTFEIDNYHFRIALQMEKDQISKAWENGFRSTGEGWNGEMPPECQGEVLDTEQYYNETYGPQVDKK